MSEYKSLLKDSGIFAIGQLGSKLITIFFVPLYTSCLTTEEYGTADLVVMTISLVFPILTASISEAILRFCYQEEIKKESIVSVFYTIILLSTIVNLGLGLAIGFFVPVISQYYVYYIILTTLAAIETGLANYLKGCRLIKEFAAQGIVHTFVIAVANVLMLVVFKMGLTGYFLSMIVAHILTIVYIIFAGDLVKLPISFKLDKALFKEMLVYSLPLVPAGMAWWVNSSADKYMISGMLTVGDVGIYSVAHKIPTILTTITGFFLSAWQLSAIKNVKSPNYGSFFSTVVKSVNCILIIGSGAIILSCQILAKILFQNDFYVAWKVVPLLTVASCFSTIAGVFASAFTAAKKTNILFISTSVGAVVNIIANYYLINAFGIMGASIATCLSFLVMVVVRYCMMTKNLVKLHINLWKDIISFFLILAESIIIFRCEEYFYPITSLFFVVLFMIYIKDINWLVKSFKKNIK